MITILNKGKQVFFNFKIEPQPTPQRDLNKIGPYMAQRSV